MLETIETALRADSGAKGRDKRPGLDAMLKAVNAKEFDMVAAWSVDRSLAERFHQ